MTTDVEDAPAALLERISAARSILMTAPGSPIAAHMALRALDGSLLEGPDKRWHETAAQNSGSCESCLAAWGDGWHAGFTEGQRQCRANHGTA